MQLVGAISLQCGQQTNRVTVSGLPITIEHHKGTQRLLRNDAGKVVYKKHMFHSYGFFNRTKGRDGDEVDCFVGPMPNAKEVFIVHMKDMGPDKDQREDEDKCMIGFPSADAAKQAFLLHYPESFYDGMTSLPLKTFKKKMRTASLPYRKKKITATIALGAKVKKCPHCGSKKFSLMPTDFETAKCNSCKKNFPYEMKAGLQPVPAIKYGGPGGTALGSMT